MALKRKGRMRVYTAKDHTRGTRHPALSRNSFIIITNIGNSIIDGRNSMRATTPDWLRLPVCVHGKRCQRLLRLLKVYRESRTQITSLRYGKQKYSNRWSTSYWMVGWLVGWLAEKWGCSRERNRTRLPETSAEPYLKNNYKGKTVVPIKGRGHHKALMSKLKVKGSTFKTNSSTFCWGCCWERQHRSKSSCWYRPRPKLQRYKTICRKHKHEAPLNQKSKNSIDIHFRIGNIHLIQFLIYKVIKHSKLIHLLQLANKNFLKRLIKYIETRESMK